MHWNYRLVLSLEGTLSVCEVFYEKKKITGWCDATLRGPLDLKLALKDIAGYPVLKVSRRPDGRHYLKTTSKFVSKEQI